MRISYMTEPIEDYAKALSEADTLAKLSSVLESHKLIAADAMQLVAQWSDADFQDWRKALKSERRGKFMGNENAARFAAVLMPEVMFQVGIIAEECKCPWGVAYIRMREMGRIVEVNSIAQMRT